jgi:membrane-associated phospholipid phosphatase
MMPMFESKLCLSIAVLLFIGFPRISVASPNGRDTDGDSLTIRVEQHYVKEDSSTKSFADDYLPKWYDMIARIPGDWIEYSKETFQMKNIPPFIGIAGATAALMVVDRQWYWTEKKWYDESPAFHRVSDWFVFTGDGRFQFGIVGAFAGYGFVFGDARALRTASETTEAILACGGIVQLLKHVTGRESPYVATKRTGAWRFFPNQIQYAKHVPHYDAFPSGHLATATATLIVIAENYSELPWLKPVGYVALGAISSSLVAYGIHWWSDFPLAFVLGYSFGEIASHPLGIKLDDKRDDKDTKISFAPVVFRRGVGLGMKVSF